MSSITGSLERRASDDVQDDLEQDQKDDGDLQPQSAAYLAAQTRLKSPGIVCLPRSDWTRK